MRCPKCGGDTAVIDSRLTTYNRIRRRRKCKECGYRFSTLEVNRDDIE